MSNLRSQAQHWHSPKERGKCYVLDNMSDILWRAAGGALLWPPLYKILSSCPPQLVSTLYLIHASSSIIHILLTPASVWVPIDSCTPPSFSFLKGQKRICFSSGLGLIIYFLPPQVWNWIKHASSLLATISIFALYSCFILLRSQVNYAFVNTKHQLFPSHKDGDRIKSHWDRL